MIAHRRPSGCPEAELQGFTEHATVGERYRRPPWTLALFGTKPGPLSRELR